MNNFKTATFKDGVVSLDVRVSVEDGTIWLSIAEMAKLFNIGVSTVRRYINTTYNGLSDDSDEKKPKMNLSCAYLNKTKPITLYGEAIIIGIAEKYNYKSIDLLKSFIDSLKAEKEVKEIIPSNQSNIIIYNNGSINLDVNVSPDEDTVWLTQAQIALLFETTQQNVSLHIKNILEEGELFSDTIYKDYLYMPYGHREYKVRLFNLDLILAVGYRIKGKRAIEFRKWATTVLKNYLIKGYAVDGKRTLVSLDNLNQLENKVEQLKHDFEAFKRNSIILSDKEKIYFRGEWFDSYDYICSLMASAKNEVIIIDPYFDFNGLKILSKISQDINKTIYLSSKSKLSNRECNLFIKQYGELHVRKTDDFHDRFIIIDQKDCYTIGASLNYLGSKTFAITKLETECLIKAIIQRVSETSVIKID